MTLKRKRSESEFSFASSSSAFSSPTRPFGSTIVPHIDFLSTTPAMPSPSCLPGRTMKRFRDGRPPEEIIHQRTLNILYSAAQNQHQPRQQPQPEILLTQQQQQQQQQHGGDGGERERQHQTSLHSFWKLPPTSAAAVTSPSSGICNPSSYGPPTSCEDCGQSLGGAGGDGDGDDGGADAMDVDGGGDGEASCGACGKHVCSHCSITNLGEQRRWCLACAGRRVAVGVSSSSGGGLRWPAAASGVGVC